jgi:hypothetical protein
METAAPAPAIRRRGRPCNRFRLARRRRNPELARREGPHRSGHWRVVVMNADASPRVVADAKVGVAIRGALPIAISFLALGLALAAGAVALGAGAARP